MLRFLDLECSRLIVNFIPYDVIVDLYVSLIKNYVMILVKGIQNSMRISFLRITVVWTQFASNQINAH
jgi:hypothetical protein